MSIEEMVAFFALHSESFDYSTYKKGDNNDLKAFALLDKLVPSEKNEDMVSAAGHDKIWLRVEPDKLAAVVTPEQIKLLHDCGVGYDEETDSLYMFR